MDRGMFSGTPNANCLKSNENWREQETRPEIRNTKGTIGSPSIAIFYFKIDFLGRNHCHSNTCTEWDGPAVCCHRHLTAATSKKWGCIPSILNRTRETGASTGCLLFSYINKFVIIFKSSSRLTFDYYSIILQSIQIGI